MSTASRSGTLLTALAAALYPAHAWAQATATRGVIIVKQPGKEAAATLSPMVQALISFGIGLVVILLLVFMTNMILMKGLKVNPISSSRFSILGGLLLIYCLFAVLFTPVFLGAGKIVMYLVLAAAAVGTVFTVVTHK